MPDPTTFRLNTQPNSQRKSYGSNLVKVLAALEVYHANRQSVVPGAQEAALYSVWKECLAWLALKADKFNGTKAASSLSLRRKGEVEDLRDEAIAELQRISPALQAALARIEGVKQGGAYHNLQGLGAGYKLERQWYEKHDKISGAVPSGKSLNGILPDRLSQVLKPGPFSSKPKFHNLSISDVERILGNQTVQLARVSFLNKIARLQYYAAPDPNGLLCDINGAQIGFTSLWRGKLQLQMYAMDKYGNVFVSNSATPERGVPVLKLNPGTKQYRQAATPAYFNHSSFLAGANVLCAGCIHIGYDNQARQAKPGALSAIDNMSGHYKPERAHLKQCLEALEAQGVDVSHTRVGVFMEGTNSFLYWWGHNFMQDQVAPDWTDSHPIPDAPPISETA